MNYKEEVRGFLRSINGNVDLIKKKLNFRKKPAEKHSILPGWEEGIQAFFREMNGFELRWIPFDFQEKPHVIGSVNLLSAKAIAGSWEGIVYHNHTKNEKLLDFRIIDFFVDEAAVGFYDLPGEREELYLYHFEANPLPLNVNFAGYLRLLINTRGYFYWQKSLLAIESGVGNQEHEDLKTYLPQVFPDFKYDEFKKLYYSVRLRS